MRLSPRYVRNYTNTSVQTCTEQGQYQRTHQGGWGKSHKASTLQEEAQAIEKNWEQERKASPRTSKPTACSVPNGHPWKRIKTNITKTEQAIFRDKYECLYICTITIIEDKKAINLKANRKRYMEGIKVGKGKKKCVNSVIKSFFLITKELQRNNES